MPTFSKASLDQLATCHPDLQRIAHAAIELLDFTVLEGHRNQAKQDAAVKAGNSKTPWPQSKHNHLPSLAMDCAPYPIDWSGTPKSLERFVFMHGIFHTLAAQLGVTIRSGIDWNGNHDMRGEGTFRDYPHVELKLEVQP